MIQPSVFFDTIVQWESWVQPFAGGAVSKCQVLDIPATRPISTRVLIGRVAGLGSNPTHVCFHGQGFKSRYCPVSTDNASLYLKARYSYLRMPDRQTYLGEEHWSVTYVQQVLLLLGSPATRPISTRVLTGRVAWVHPHGHSTSGINEVFSEFNSTSILFKSKLWILFQNLSTSLVRSSKNGFGWSKVHPS